MKRECPWCKTKAKNASQFFCVECGGKMPPEKPPKNAKSWLRRWWSGELREDRKIQRLRAARDRLRAELEPANGQLDAMRSRAETLKQDAVKSEDAERRQQIAVELSRVRRDIASASGLSRVRSNQLKSIESAVHNLEVIRAADREDLPNSEELIEIASQAEERVEQLAEMGSLGASLTNAGMADLADDEESVLAEIETARAGVRVTELSDEDTDSETVTVPAESLSKTLSPSACRDAAVAAKEASRGFGWLLSLEPGKTDAQIERSERRRSDARDTDSD